MVLPASSLHCCLILRPLTGLERSIGILGLFVGEEVRGKPQAVDPVVVNVVLLRVVDWLNDGIQLKANGPGQSRWWE